MTHSSDTAVHPHQHALKNDDGSWKYTNDLIHQSSPYLLQHAHNPVDWHAWGADAFEMARQQGKPIFLSIGYSTCYWCHVMERQVFENPVIAAQMNDLFINIKVDREERPDVDDLYMTATQMMTGRGGWPMSVFLTPPGAADEDDPGLKPFWAGTYVPPQPMHGMPGFPQLLEGLASAWADQRQGVTAQAHRVAKAVSQHLEHRDLAGPVGADLVHQVAGQLLQTYDPNHAGFGGAPKFPQPANLSFLLTAYVQNQDPHLYKAIAHTLDRMARGGMYDQVGGGFHRYSVDAMWLVPHFEKMLYDNGQLLEVYAAAIAHAADDAARQQYARVIRETCEYVLREMTDASGAFWSAQDAEVNAHEGGNYIWTPSEIEQAIDDPQLAALALKMYGLTQGTNFQDPHIPGAPPVNVLYLPVSLAELADEMGVSRDQLHAQRSEINNRLKRARDTRDQPGTDDKVIVSWNGLAIAGLAKTGSTLNEQRYIAAAGRAADAIVAHMSDGETGLLRTMRNGDAKIPAFFEDYAFFVHGLIELHRAHPDQQRWRDLAIKYTEAAIDRFQAEDGSYFDTLESQGDLFVRLRSTYDGAIPCGNSQMAHNLLDLYELTQDRQYLNLAARCVRSFGRSLREQGAGMIHMHHALMRGLAVRQGLFEEDATAGVLSPDLTQPVVARVDPTELSMADGDSVATVTLDIAEGFHVNAVDAQTHGLTPTQLQMRGTQGVSIEVVYPEPIKRQFSFADQALSVYENQVKLKATLRSTSPIAQATTVKLVLRYQACTATACLSPQAIELPVTLLPE